MAKKKKNESNISNDEAQVVGSLLANAAEQLSNFDELAAEAPAHDADEALEAAAPEKKAKKKKSKKKSSPVESAADEATVDSESAEEIEVYAEEVLEASMENTDDEASENEDSGSEDELAEFGSTNIFTEEEPASFLPEASEAEASEEDLPDVESVEGTELDSFESAQIEEVEFVEEERLDSILESILFASDRPVSMASMKMVFKGTNVKGDKIRRALDRLAVELAGARRGVTLEEVPGGYQIRTKSDNLQFLTRTLKARQFKLSGPALEVLAIVAYKQPLVKNEIDEIRGVESGHLLRALMEKGLVNFEGKSDLPGKPMLYGTTKKFLEIFGLRNLKELPTLSQIDELLPEGMTEEEAKPTLSQVTEAMSQAIGTSYSESEEELEKITDQLVAIDTSSEFFEQEKLRQKQKRDEEKAQNIREALALGESVPTRDKNWLAKYDEALMAGNTAQFAAEDQKEAIQEEKQLEGELDLEFSGEEVALVESEAAVEGELIPEETAMTAESLEEATEVSENETMMASDDESGFIESEASDSEAELAFVEEGSGSDEIPASEIALNDEEDDHSGEASL